MDAFTLCFPECLGFELVCLALYFHTSVLEDILTVGLARSADGSPTPPPGVISPTHERFSALQLTGDMTNKILLYYAYPCREAQGELARENKVDWASGQHRSAGRRQPELVSAAMKKKNPLFRWIDWNQTQSRTALGIYNAGGFEGWLSAEYWLPCSIQVQL